MGVGGKHRGGGVFMVGGRGGRGINASWVGKGGSGGLWVVRERGWGSGWEMVVRKGVRYLPQKHTCLIYTYSHQLEVCPNTRYIDDD